MGAAGGTSTVILRDVRSEGAGEPLKGQEAEGLRGSGGDEGLAVAEGDAEAGGLRDGRVRGLRTLGCGLGTLRGHEETDDVNTQKAYALQYLCCDKKLRPIVYKFYKP